MHAHHSPTDPVCSGALSRRALGRVWRLRLDLGALVASAPDRIALVGFLQRRREPPLRAQPGTSVLARAPQGPKVLTLGVIRTMLQVCTPTLCQQTCC